ncbi:MAG TPA: hypothetical protein VFS97_05310 [Nitrososphaeraceae archaeon]|nr:hypothetical protein [Nitrososphaeraceae archaeon]
MSISKETHTGEQSTIRKERRSSVRHIILILGDIAEYNRIKELGDLVKYHSKLMSHYGFNVKSAKWNTRVFPVTQNDAQLEGIQSDVERYNNAVKNYNKYAEQLAQNSVLTLKMK